LAELRILWINAECHIKTRQNGENVRDAVMHEIGSACRNWPEFECEGGVNLTRKSLPKAMPKTIPDESMWAGCIYAWTQKEIYEWLD
jgi:hypothetical protein